MQTHQPSPKANPEPDARSVVDRVFAGAVYAALLELCPLEDRDRQLWRSVGFPGGFAEEGRFGSISSKRARMVLGRLVKRFGAGELVRVPGFEEDPRGRVTMPLFGDFALIPYLDPRGLITAIEGIPVQASETGDPPDFDDAPAVLLSGPEDHLYVFPRYGLQEVEAVCEGLPGALRAAACGLPIAAIRGPGKYAPAPGEQTLPELEGANFADREILYLPTLSQEDPDQRAIHAAPAAARRLLARHGARPAILAEPLGETGDLAHWLAAIPTEEHPTALDRLRAASKPLDGAEAEAGQQPRDATPTAPPGPEPAEPQERYPAPELPPDGLILRADLLAGLKAAGVSLALLAGVSLACLLLIPLLARLSGLAGLPLLPGLLGALVGAIAPLALALLALAPLAAPLLGLLAALLKARIRRQHRRVLLGQITH